MGKQIGIINVRGKVGDMGYVKTEDGYYIRRNTSVTGDRIRTDAAFKGTRQINEEFGAAGKAGKLIRDAIRIQLKLAGDSKTASRMVKVLMHALKKDTANLKGSRRPETGEFGFLNGFEFNRHNELLGSFLVQYVVNFDRASGEATIDFPEFIPSDVLLVPDDSTHFRLVSAACELDFKKQEYVLSKAESAFLSVGNEVVNPFSMEQQLSAASDKAIVMILGIRFYQLVNGNYYQLNGDKFNAVRIVKTDIV